MTRATSKFIIAFGRLLDIAPRGNTVSSNNLTALLQTAKTRKDCDALTEDFVKIGQDIKTSMDKFGREQGLR